MHANLYTNLGLAPYIQMGPILIQTAVNGITRVMFVVYDERFVLLHIALFMYDKTCEVANAPDTFIALLYFRLQ